MGPGMYADNESVRPLDNHSRKFVDQRAFADIRQFGLVEAAVMLKKIQVAGGKAPAGSLLQVLLHRLELTPCFRNDRLGAISQGNLDRALRFGVDPDPGSKQDFLDLAAERFFMRQSRGYGCEPY